MSGLIRNEDVAYVRDHTQIDSVIGEYVQLKHAGGGQKKGLCPFHDEKSPSFNVNTSKGFFHCFGCGTGGDVIAFIMKLDHLSFTEAIENLADRMGYQLQYDASSASSAPTISKSRLIAANTAAMEFYRAELKLAQPKQVESFSRSGALIAQQPRSSLSVLHRIPGTRSTNILRLLDSLMKR